MQFEPIDNNFISRHFNDRRAGGTSQNRAVGKNLYDPKKLAELRMQEQKDNRHQPPYGETGRPNAGGTKVPKKPKTPKGPMPARAIAMKHELKGY